MSAAAEFFRAIHIHTPVQIAGSLAIVATVAVAMRWGKAPERAVAWFTLLAWHLTPFLQQGLYGLQVNFVIVDLVYLAVLIGVALRSDRFWPLWASAFHVLAMLMHLAMAFSPTDMTRAYLTGTYISAYLVILSIAIGAIVEGSRRRNVDPRGRSEGPRALR